MEFVLEIETHDTLSRYLDIVYVLYVQYSTV
jgi:hypothetical protein